MSALARLRRSAPIGLATMLAVSGTLHLTRPRPYLAIMPRALPAHRQLVYASGVAELVCAYGLLARRGWASAASTALLVAIFPANVQMAVDSGSGRLPGLADNRLVAWARLPLQAPLVWAARQRPARGVR